MAALPLFPPSPPHNPVLCMAFDYDTDIYFDIYQQIHTVTSVFSISVWQRLA